MSIIYTKDQSIINIYEKSVLGAAGCKRDLNMILTITVSIIVFDAGCRTQKKDLN